MVPVAKQNDVAKQNEMDKCVRMNLGQRGYIAQYQIGTGAFSKVYRIKRQMDGQIYACKVTVEQQQWTRESALLQLLAQAENDLFPKMLEYWQAEGVFYLVMEYLPGQNLDSLMERRGHLSQRQAVIIGKSLAEGLAFLEEQAGVLYRDLKPENIKISEDGRVKLMDFGCVCRIPEAGRRGLSGPDGRAGTPGYAAPEQFKEHESVGTYSDVYALGRLLHYLLTGDNPYLPPVRKPPIRAYNPGFSRSLEQFVEECVQWEGRERLPDMRCVLRRLSNLVVKRNCLRYWCQELRAMCRRKRVSRYFYEKCIVKVKRNIPYM